jgi:hypothetical protein
MKASDVLRLVISVLCVNLALAIPLAGEEIETAELVAVVQLVRSVGLHDIVFSIHPPERAVP